MRAGGIEKERIAGGSSGGDEPPVDFEDLTALVVMATGWTWEYVWENMTLQRLGIMSRLWKKTPPEHVSAARIYSLFAAWLGVKDSETASTDDQAAARLMNLPEIEE